MGAPEHRFWRGTCESDGTSNWSLRHIFSKFSHQLKGTIRFFRHYLDARLKIVRFFVGGGGGASMADRRGSRWPFGLFFWMNLQTFNFVILSIRWKKIKSSCISAPLKKISVHARIFCLVFSGIFGHIEKFYKIKKKHSIWFSNTFEFLKKTALG